MNEKNNFYEALLVKAERISQNLAFVVTILRIFEDLKLKNAFFHKSD